MSRDYFKLSNATVPVTAAAAAASLITQCDPVLLGLAAAIQACLRAKLDTAWAAAAQKFGDEYGAHAVNETITYNPGEAGMERRPWKWPLLAIWRTSDSFADRTLLWDGNEAEFACVYVLPPMDQETAARLGYIRPAVARTVRNLLEQGSDSTFESGADFLIARLVEQATLTRAEYGEAFEQANMQLYHLGVDMTIVVKERENPVTTGIEDLDSVYTYIDLVGDPDLQNVIEMLTTIT